MSFKQVTGMEVLYKLATSFGGCEAFSYLTFKQKNGPKPVSIEF